MCSKFCLTNIFRVALRDGWDPVKLRPSQCLIHILLFQPFYNGVKVVQQWAGIHLVGPYSLLEDLRPRFGRASLKNFPREGRMKLFYTFTASVNHYLWTKVQSHTSEWRLLLQSGRCHMYAKDRCDWLPRTVSHETGTAGWSWQNICRGKDCFINF